MTSSRPSEEQLAAAREALDRGGASRNGAATEDVVERLKDEFDATEVISPEPGLTVVPGGDGAGSVDLPERGLIYDYVATFEPTTEAPRQYHVAAALALVSMAVGRDAWIELAGQLHLNLYLLILGPSTEVRKSTAIGQAERVLRQAAERHPEQFEESWILPSGTVSPEALVLRLANVDRGLLVLDEFARLLAGAQSKRYMADLKELLTEVYRCWSPGRLAREKPIDAGPCFLSLIGATTRSRFEEEITAEDIGSGFLGRFLLVYAHSTDRVLAWPPAPDPQAVNGIVDQLAEIAATVRGEIRFEEDAKAAITAWYTTRRRELAEADDAERALPIFFRLDATVRKLAALFEIAARPRAEIVVSAQAVQDAIAYADFVLGEIRRFLLDGALGEIARKLRRIQGAITAQPGIRKSSLQKETNIAEPEFGQLTNLLAGEGEIEARAGLGRNKRGIGYWPVEAGA